MKKFYLVCIIISLSFFLLPYNTKVFLFKEIYKNIEEPLQHLCVFQKSIPSYHIMGVPAPNTGCFINEAILKEKIKNGLPVWAKQQIQEDLSKFNTVRSTDLEQYFEENLTNNSALWRFENALIRFKIVNHKVHIFRTVQNMGFVMNVVHESIYHVLQYLAENNYIPDTDFILAARDFIMARTPPSIPIFTFAKDLTVSAEKDAILIPDWQNLSSVNNFRDRITKAKKLYPWKDKQDLLFWRGSKFDSTGFREKLVSLAFRYPNLIDAKFNSHEKITFVEPEDHLRYKYLISVDGARCAWERLIWHLHSNSLTFKNESAQVQWFYKGITPYVHYIPVQDEASLLSALNWAKIHPTEVQSIIHNASTFVEQNLALEDMYHYIIVLLQEYTKKLKMDQEDFHDH